MIEVEDIKKDDPLLMIPCVERCGLVMVGKLPLSSLELENICAAKHWVLSVMSPPGTPIMVGILCPDCAKRVHSPEVLKEMRRRRLSREKS
jgi:hypothetical protein